MNYRGVAQLELERRASNAEVVGSSPTVLASLFRGVAKLDKAPDYGSGN